MNIVLPFTRLSKKLFINDVVKGNSSHSTILRNFHITSFYMKEVRVGSEMVKVGTHKYGIIEGERAGSVHDINHSYGFREAMFPDEETPNWIFKGVPYKELPVVDIKSTPNNTIFSLSDYEGKVLIVHSAGMEGFKNARKGTNIAAQQAAISFSELVQKKSMGTVRVRVQGIGAGRMAALKGLQMGGVDIVSITDTTRVSWDPPRPRKPRRL